jgi:hypothetical protein
LGMPSSRILIDLVLDQFVGLNDFNFFTYMQ